MDGKIYKAISEVMKDVGAIAKTDTNDYDHYKFRGIDAVYNALQPALVKHGVFISPELINLEQEDREASSGKVQLHTKVNVKYTLFAEDGSSIETVFPGEAMDRSDKSINKAMTAAYKYMLFELFTIPTDNNQDADSESPEAGASSKKSVRDQMLDYCKEKKLDMTEIAEEFGLKPKMADDERLAAFEKLKDKYGA